MKAFSILFSLALFTATCCRAEVQLGKLSLPTGFKVAVWAKVPNARSMALSPDGRLFVGTSVSAVYVEFVRS